MSLFGFLLLVLLGYFIIWPVVRTLFKINAARKRYADMMNNMGAAGRQERSRKAGWSGRTRSQRKKISDDTGEYVAFEDIRVTNVGSSADSDAHAASFEREQQIEDAEWEEIR